MTRKGDEQKLSEWADRHQRGTHIGKDDREEDHVKQEFGGLGLKFDSEREHGTSVPPRVG